MRAALANLLDNAFQHGGPGVRVWLRVQTLSAPPRLVLSVFDDGRGLADTLLQALAANDASDQAPGPLPIGAGLGLHIARQVMLQHGGQLQLSPLQPRGLAADLVLPLPAV